MSNENKNKNKNLFGNDIKDENPKKDKAKAKAHGNIKIHK